LQLFLALAALDVCARWLQVRDNRVGLVGPVVLYLGQASLEHFHEAVAVGVIVDGRRLSFVPAQNHQIEAIVSGIDEIPRVPGRVQDETLISECVSCGTPRGQSTLFVQLKSS
jgi:hypothetical protein